MKSQYRKEFEALAAGGLKNRDKMRAFFTRLQAEGKWGEFIDELGEDKEGQEVLRDIFGGFEMSKQGALTEEEQKDFDQILAGGGTEQYWQAHPDERRRSKLYMEKMDAHARRPIEQALQNIKSVTPKLSSEDRDYLKRAFSSHPLEFVRVVGKWKDFIQSKALTAVEAKDFDKFVNVHLVSHDFAESEEPDPYGWPRLTDDYLMNHPEEGRWYRACLDKIEAVLDSGKWQGLVSWWKIEEEGREREALLEQMTSEVGSDKMRVEGAKWLGLPPTATDAEVMAVVEKLPKHRQSELQKHMFNEVLLSESPTALNMQGIDGVIRRFRNSETGRTLREAGRNIFEAALLIIENDLRKRAGIKPKEELYTSPAKSEDQKQKQSVFDRVAQEIEAGATTEELTQTLLNEAEARFKQKFGDSRGKEMRKNLERRLFAEGLTADEEF